MTDETPENEIVVEKDDDREEPETENTEDVPEDNEDDQPYSRYSSARPYIRYTSMPRHGSIWNSPLGLLTTFLIASKAIDLAYRAMMEREKTKRTVNQQKQK